MLGGCFFSRLNMVIKFALIGKGFGYFAKHNQVDG
jgi:hypothetical protein